MSIIVQDSFTDVDGTLLENHITNSGHTWGQISATELILSVRGINGIF